MGPSLARLCRRAADASGKPRRILAVSRRQAAEPGIDALPCDLLDRAQVARLPVCPNVLYLAGRKFGSSGNPALTWAMNAVVPVHVAEHFRSSRIVVFSTGNVYPLRTLAEGGSRESDSPAPVGEYAQSCLARERVFEYYAREHGLRCLLFRLNYAVDLRYGVLVDIARKVHAGEPVEPRRARLQRDLAARCQLLRAALARAVRQSAAHPQYHRARHRAGARCRPILRHPLRPRAALHRRRRRCLPPQQPLGRHRTDGPDASVGTTQLMEMVADWVAAGGPSLDKPTHFEVNDGKF